jgi:AcrR family transcriptional regulator
LTSFDDPSIIDDMGTTARKEREFRQREQTLLDAARRMLLEQGYAGLSMERLAEATEYSKGTVYQHFTAKEDLVAALAVQSIEQRLELFVRARQFVGRPREKMLALGVADQLFARLRPDYFRSELVVRTANLADRARPERCKALLAYEKRIAGWLRDLVQAAVDEGDLSLSPPTTTGSVAYALFSMVIGAHAALLNPDLIRYLELQPSVQILQRNMDFLLDGIGWKPLRSEWNYELTAQRVQREIFPQEYQSLGVF